MPADQRASEREERFVDVRAFVVAYAQAAKLVQPGERALDQRDQLAILDDPRRSLLGRAQEEWLFGELRQSARRGTRWQLLGQQVMFAPAAPQGQPSGSTDNWDGYRPARDRIVEFLGANRMKKRRDPHRRRPQLLGV